MADTDIPGMGGLPVMATAQQRAPRPIVSPFAMLPNRQWPPLQDQQQQQPGFNVQPHTDTHRMGAVRHHVESDGLAHAIKTIPVGIVTPFFEKGLAWGLADAPRGETPPLWLRQRARDDSAHPRTVATRRALQYAPAPPTPQAR